MFVRVFLVHATIASMKLISWNVNGIRAVHRKGSLAELMKQENPAIVCLQETKAEQHQSEIDLPEYEEYWNSSRGRKGYSGVAIFSKEVPISVRFDFPAAIVKRYHLQDAYGNLNAEGRVIAAEYKDFWVVNCYTPNAKPDLSRLEMRHKHWDPAFLAYCKELEAEKPVIFCGDLNVAHTPDDLAKPKENEGDHGFTKEEREGVDNILAAGFVDTFRLFTQGNGHYTWLSNFGNARARNVGWRIDYFFVSRKLTPKIQKAHILPQVLGSDHCPVVLEIK